VTIEGKRAKTFRVESRVVPDRVSETTVRVRLSGEYGCTRALPLAGPDQDHGKRAFHGSGWRPALILLDRVRPP